jgi:hypothetical protein
MGTNILNPFEIYGVGGIPRNGLIAEYLYQNNFNDTSGNGYHGTYLNNTGLINFTTNRHGLNYSGVRTGTGLDRIYAPVPAFGTSSFTFNFWIKFDSDRIIGMLQASAGYTPVIDIFGGNLRVRIVDELGNNPTLRSFTIDNSWHMITVDRDLSDSGRVSIYIDNVLKHNTGFAPGNFLTTTTGYFMFNQSTSTTINGKLDDYRLYNRVLTFDDRAILFDE